MSDPPIEEDEGELIPLTSEPDPLNRATIIMLNVDDLDAELEAIRARRLTVVKQLEAVAKVKSDQHHLTTYLKFERQYARTRTTLAKLDEAMVKCEEAMHKTRILSMELDNG